MTSSGCRFGSVYLTSSVPWYTSACSSSSGRNVCSCRCQHWVPCNAYVQHHMVTRLYLTPGRQSMDHAVLWSPVRPFGTVYRWLFASWQHWDNFKNNWRRSFSARPMEHDCLHTLVTKRNSYGLREFEKCLSHTQQMVDTSHRYFGHTHTLIEIGVLKDLKLRCNEWNPNDLDLWPWPWSWLWKTFQFFTLAWRMFVASFVKKIPLATKEISHSQSSHKSNPNVLDLWPLKSFQFLPLTWRIFVTSFIKICPLNTETSCHTNFDNEKMARQTAGRIT